MHSWGGPDLAGGLGRAEVEHAGGLDLAFHLDTVETGQGDERPAVGSDEGADIEVGQADHAGEGRGDFGIGKLKPLLVERGIKLLELALGLIELRLGDVEFILGDRLAGNESLLAVALDPGEVELRLSRPQRPSAESTEAA